MSRAPGGTARNDRVRCHPWDRSAPRIPCSGSSQPAPAASRHFLKLHPAATCRPRCGTCNVSFPPGRILGSDCRRCWSSSRQGLFSVTAACHRLTCQVMPLCDKAPLANGVGDRHPVSERPDLNFILTPIRTISKRSHRFWLLLWLNVTGFTCGKLDSDEERKVSACRAPPRVPAQPGRV